MTQRLKKLLKPCGWLVTHLRSYWKKNSWHKVVVVLFTFLLLVIGTMYSIARWYMWSERTTPTTLGVSFIPDYATQLGVDPQKTFTAILDDLHVKQVRLVSYWSDIESNKGTYDFSQLDWQVHMAEQRGVKITLSIGLRQPRWPECHMPTWADSEPASVWQPQLEEFMTAVVDRYKNSSSIQSYQLENEYFLTAFGTCTNYSRQRLIDEFNLVKRLDSKHPIIISRSDNAIGWPINNPKADEYGISIYKRVWSPPVGRYVEYPFPAWFYAFLAGAEKLWSGRDMIIHELQAEPWPPHGQDITKTSLAEQNKSFDAHRFASRIAYGKATGMKTIDLWGAEYWYYRLTILHDPSIWNVAQQALRAQQTH